jgi:small subunit ribosomal protein S16
VAVKIRLKRMGKIRAPFYRVVVMDSRTKRDGRAIEEIGKYHPTAEPSVIEIDMDRATYWLGQGAQPTEAVAAMLKLYADGAVKTAEPKKSKRELYEAAVAAAGGSSLDAKDTPARKSAPAKKAAAKSAEKTAEKSAEKTAEKAAEAPATADTDSGAAAAQSTDTSDEPAATTAAAATDAPAADATTTDATSTGDATDATDGGYGADSAVPNADGSAPDGFAVKGNKDSMKYHEPDGQWYDQTVAEVWFRTSDAAEKAGFVKAGS